MRVGAHRGICDVETVSGGALTYRSFVGHTDGYHRGRHPMYKVGGAVDGVHDPQPLFGQEGLQGRSGGSAAAWHALLAKHRVCGEGFCDGCFNYLHI